jgi:hypothetical protein
MFSRLISSGSERRRAPIVCSATVLLALALSPLALADDGTTGMGSGTGTVTAPKPVISATVEQCVTSVTQAERMATFAGEMTALPGTAKMQMRIDVFERTLREPVFHVVIAPGLGVWRTSAPGVKDYRYLKAVTNLSAPAYYRALVRFRWLNAKGRLIEADELRTPKCLEPAAPAPKAAEEAPASSSAPAPNG